MRKCTVVGKWIVLFVCGIVCAQGTSSGPAFASKVSKTTQVFWFSDEKSQGLRQDSSGYLYVSDRKLPIKKPVGRLFAAAYYQSTGTLVTVDYNSNTHLYERAGKLLKLKQTTPPHEMDVPHSHNKHIRPVFVHFCNKPGLIYLTWSYPESSVPLQIRTRYSERLVLGSWARDWHAATTENPRVSFLDYTYRMASPRSVHLFMPNGKKIIVRLPGQLSKPLRTPPYYIDLEPVFVIPGRAIICKIHNGWSMHDLKGNLIRHFHFGRMGYWEWHEPFYRNGHFYIPLIGPKSAEYYRMDIPTGKLVNVGEHFPQ